MPRSATELAPSPPPPSTPVPTEAAPLIARCVALVHDDLVATEAALHELLRSPITVIPELSGHLAFAGGKRLRPLLTLLCARAAGYDAAHRVTVAAAGELVHTATLLHDDVIDEGEFRRGRPTARMHYGNGLAVLTGDYCLARAVQAIARTRCADAVVSMSDTITLMAEGEVAQLLGAGAHTLSRARYDLIIERKTAALIAWCTSLGGLVQQAYAAALHEFGMQLGYAFQIADDLLDYQVGTGVGVTGKDPGQDLREGKWTLPLLLACEDDEMLRVRVQEALAAGPPMAEATVAHIVERVVHSDGPARARAAADHHAALAVAALTTTLPPSTARDALVDVTHYVVRRRA